MGDSSLHLRAFCSCCDTPSCITIALSPRSDAVIIEIVLCALGDRNGFYTPACTGPVKCYGGAFWSKENFSAESEGAECHLCCVETMWPYRSSKQYTQVQALVSWLAFLT